MKSNIKEVQKIQKQFIKKFMDPDNGINMCGISNLRVRQDYYGYKLQTGESLDDLCLTVGFEKEVPKNNQIPQIYKGVRVFCEVVGKIVLH